VRARAIRRLSPEAETTAIYTSERQKVHYRRGVVCRAEGWVTRRRGDALGIRSSPPTYGRICSWRHHKRLSWWRFKYRLLTRETRNYFDCTDRQLNGRLVAYVARWCPQRCDIGVRGPFTDRLVARVNAVQYSTSVRCQFSQEYFMNFALRFFDPLSPTYIVSAACTNASLFIKSIKLTDSQNEL